MAEGLWGQAIAAMIAPEYQEKPLEDELRRELWVRLRFGPIAQDSQAQRRPPRTKACNKVFTVISKARNFTCFESCGWSFLCVVKLHPSLLLLPQEAEP